MKLLYDIAIRSFSAVAGLAKAASPKMKILVEGRKGLFDKASKFAEDHQNIAWFHVASLGEYEQAKPVIAKLKEKMPEYSVAVTFFSPSGYENVIKKSQPNVDFISYIPFDTPENAEKFISILNPKVVFFVKYDLWANFILEAKRRNIPLFLFSATLRPDQIYFKSYGGFLTNVLKSFDYIFVQNQTTLDLLTTIGFSSASITGDTRFDNVNDLSRAPKKYHEIGEWISGSKVMVIGSAWQEDMDLLFPLINSDLGYKYIIAPHDIDIKKINQWQNDISKKSTLYSQLHPEVQSEVLFIDNIGMLSSLYQYGELAYVGGAFGKGLHNILEPLAYHIPVIFGNLKKTIRFPEAAVSINYGCGYTVGDSAMLMEKIMMLQDKNHYEKSSQAANKMVRDNLGSAEKIMAQVMIHIGK